MGPSITGKAMRPHKHPVLSQDLQVYPSQGLQGPPGELSQDPQEFLLQIQRRTAHFAENGLYFKIGKISPSGQGSLIHGRNLDQRLGNQVQDVVTHGYDPAHGILTALEARLECDDHRGHIQQERPNIQKDCKYDKY